MHQQNTFLTLQAKVGAEERSQEFEHHFVWMRSKEYPPDTIVARSIF
jgi:hypothetical protein